MSKMKTPREFGAEILRDWDLGGAEYGPLDLLEVRIMRAMEQERERCAKLAEDLCTSARMMNFSGVVFRDLARKIREGT